MGRYVLLGIVFLLVGIQLVPVERTNPPVTAEIQAPAEVQAILKRACYDCHSNETVWPWYSYIAPISWRVAGHVDHGRGNLNFSTWGNLPIDEREKLRREIWEEVEEAGMPLPDYLRMHSEARLSQQDVATLTAWARHQPLSTSTPDY